MSFIDISKMKKEFNMRLRNNKKNYSKEMKKGKLLLALLGCLLLVACQKGTKSEEQRTDVWDSTLTTVSDRIGNIEAVDVELEGNSDENLTTISVLGREKLMIETERIYGTESDLGYLDNRFIPEEIDIILNAIEGTWIVDEYVGFIPYENSIWSEEEGTEEEKRKKYDDDREQAKTHLPDFSFQIKSYNSENPTDCSQYIYVYNDNESYASPMSVALSMQEEDGYSGFINRTIQGSDISKFNGYPVIYIDFFSIFCSQEGRVTYEPTTLILASDGSFLLLKDGAFYSLKNSIQGTIMSGDFSCLEDTDWERMQESYEREINLYEWCQLDLNSDGIEDLILQEKNTVDEDSNQHRILGIFGCGKDEARCVLWDDVYMGDFSFCGSTGELMHYYYSFGGMVDIEGYEHYYYDMEWNKVIDYRLLIYDVNSPEGYDYPTKWFEAHPDMQEEGIYYRRYEGACTSEDTEGEVLTLEELKEIYETEMGMEMYSFRYVR